MTFAYGNQEFSEPIRGEGNHILACRRYPVRKLIRFDDDGNIVDAPGNIIPRKYIEALQHNQKIALCCRHPENHDIEAWYSCQEEFAAGKPDVYILHCTCGRKHRRFCVGGSQDPVTGEETHPRPFWTVR